MAITQDPFHLNVSDKQISLVCKQCEKMVDMFPNGVNLDEVGMKAIGHHMNTHNGTTVAERPKDA